VTYTYIYTYTYLYLYINIHTYIYIYKKEIICTYISRFYIILQKNMHIHMQMHMYVHINVHYTHTHTQTCTYTYLDVSSQFVFAIPGTFHVCIGVWRFHYCVFACTRGCERIHSGPVIAGAQNSNVPNIGGMLANFVTALRDQHLYNTRESERTL